MLLFDNLVKNYQYKFKEDDEMKKYYNELFDKYGKENNDDLIDITIFGTKLKIPKKLQKTFYNKFINHIKLKNKMKREQKHIHPRLSEILDEFNENKKNNELNENENKNLNTNTKKKRNKKKKDKANNIQDKNCLFSDLKKEENLKVNKVKDDCEYDKNYFWGVKVDSEKELEKKKEEVLLRLKHDIIYKINEGVINPSEMENFMKFQKKMNELYLEKINNRVYIKQLEEGFKAFEEQLKMHEERKKNEKRINNFVDSMNFDLYQKFELKKAIVKIFCHPTDFKNKNVINILSPFPTDVKHNKNVNKTNYKNK